MQGRELGQLLHSLSFIFTGLRVGPLAMASAAITEGAKKSQVVQNELPVFGEKPLVERDFNLGLETWQKLFNESHSLEVDDGYLSFLDSAETHFNTIKQGEPGFKSVEKNLKLISEKREIIKSHRKKLEKEQEERNFQRERQRETRFKQHLSAKLSLSSAQRITQKLQSQSPFAMQIVNRIHLPNEVVQNIQTSLDENVAFYVSYVLSDSYPIPQILLTPIYHLRSANISSLSNWTQLSQVHLSQWADQIHIDGADISFSLDGDGSVGMVLTGNPANLWLSANLGNFGSYSADKKFAPKMLIYNVQNPADMLYSNHIDSDHTYSYVDVVYAPGSDHIFAAKQEVRERYGLSVDRITGFSAFNTNNFAEEPQHDSPFWGTAGFRRIAIDPKETTLVGLMGVSYNRWVASTLGANEYAQCKVMHIFDLSVMNAYDFSMSGVSHASQQKKIASSVQGWQVMDLCLDATRIYTVGNNAYIDSYDVTPVAGIEVYNFAGTLTQTLKLPWVSPYDFADSCFSLDSSSSYLYLKHGNQIFQYAALPEDMVFRGSFDFSSAGFHASGPGSFRVSGLNAYIGGRDGILVALQGVSVLQCGVTVPAYDQPMLLTDANFLLSYGDRDPNDLIFAPQDWKVQIKGQSELQASFSQQQIFNNDVYSLGFQNRYYQAIPIHIPGLPTFYAPFNVSLLEQYASSTAQQVISSTGRSSTDQSAETTSASSGKPTPSSMYMLVGFGISIASMALANLGEETESSSATLVRRAPASEPTADKTALAVTQSQQTAKSLYSTKHQPGFFHARRPPQMTLAEFFKTEPDQQRNPDICQPFPNRYAQINR